LNLLEVNIDIGFLVIGSFKNIFIMKYNRTKRNREKIFGKKKVLALLNANINQIKLITLKQKTDRNICDYYDKENNIFYADLDKNKQNNDCQDEKSIPYNKSIF